MRERDHTDNRNSASSDAENRDVPPLFCFQDTDNKVYKCLNKKYFRAVLKALCISLFAYLLSCVLSSPLTASLSGFFSAPERGDFRITDIYAQAADSRPVRKLEDRIVLLDIGNAGREEIIDCFQTLSICEPKVVGVDINFAYPGDNDSLLIQAIKGLPKAVLPLGVENVTDHSFSLSDKPFFYESEKDFKYGIINLPAEDEHASIREYAVNYRMDTGSTIPSFAVAMAEEGDSNAASELLKRGNPRESIDYASREFLRMSIDDLMENPEKVTGRYVIVGADNEASDMHSTPINSYMSGMVIHAYSLSSLLDQCWFTTMPAWVDKVLAFTLCFMIIFTAVAFYGKLRGLILRLLQIALLIATVWVGYTAYIDHAVICNFSHTLLMITFGLLALDIWNGIEALVQMAVSYYKKLKSKLCANVS